MECPFFEPLGIHIGYLQVNHKERGRKTHAFSGSTQMFLSIEKPVVVLSSIQCTSVRACIE